MAQEVPGRAAVHTYRWLFMSEIILCETNSSLRAKVVSFRCPKMLQMLNNE